LERVTPNGGLLFCFAGESLAEPERHHGRGVEVAARGIVGDELAYRVRQFLRFDIDRQAKILADLRSRCAANRFDGVVDAVSSTFYISRACAARGGVRLGTKHVQIVACERGRAKRKREHTGHDKNPLHDGPFLCWRLRAGLDAQVETSCLVGQPVLSTDEPGRAFFRLIISGSCPLFLVSRGRDLLSVRPKSNLSQVPRRASVILHCLRRFAVLRTRPLRPGFASMPAVPPALPPRLSRDTASRSPPPSGQSGSSRANRRLHRATT